jgi:hypothetical protein
MPNDDDTDEMTILSNELMLVRAGVLPEDERDYYRSRPEKWRREIAVCSRLERQMLLAGVDPAEGWEMTMRELIEAGLKAEERGRGPSRFGVECSGCGTLMPSGDKCVGCMLREDRAARPVPAT